MLEDRLIQFIILLAHLDTNFLGKDKEMSLLNLLGQSLLAAVGMAWQVLWSLVLGF